MTDDEMLAVARQDLATVEIVGLLLSFLEMKGIVARREFIAFSREACAQWISEGQEPGLTAALKTQLDSLDLDCELPRAN